MTLLATDRLVLRPPTLADVPRVTQFVGDIDVARMLAPVPHPYTEADARWWIGTQDGAAQKKNGGQPGELVFIATLGGELIGACSHIFGDKAGTAEIGYWLGKPYWARGYGTEMATALLRHGFTDYGLSRTTVSHMVDNPASAAIIAKLGFRPTGRRRIACVSRAAEVEVKTFALTRTEAEAQGWWHGAGTLDRHGQDPQESG